MVHLYRFGSNLRGLALTRREIKKAFEQIAAHFERSLNVKQAGMAILETGDTCVGADQDRCFSKESPGYRTEGHLRFKERQR